MPYNPRAEEQIRSRLQQVVDFIRSRKFVAALVVLAAIIVMMIDHTVAATIIVLARLIYSVLLVLSRL